MATILLIISGTLFLTLCGFIFKLSNENKELKDKVRLSEETIQAILNQKNQTDKQALPPLGERLHCKGGNNYA